MIPEILNAQEARVLGTLVEKSLATPDYYPMTLNALRNACNQKTCREPVSNYSDAELEEALRSLKQKCYVTFSAYGSRGDQFKYRHFLEDARFGFNKAHLAVLAVLLLRGPQTLNEIKMRTETSYSFDSHEETETTLKSLAALNPPWVEYLEKRPGRREPRWRQLLEFSELSDNDFSESETKLVHHSLPPSLAELIERIESLEKDRDELKERITVLEKGLGL